MNLRYIKINLNNIKFILIEFLNLNLFNFIFYKT